MIYKNSVRLLFSNFNLVWKTLLYSVITFLITAGLAYVSAVPVFNVLETDGLFSLITTTFDNFFTKLNLVEFVKGIGTITTEFFAIISNHFAELWIYVLLFIFFIKVLGKFLFCQTKLASAYCLYSSMSNNMKMGMFSAYFSNMGKILLYELIRLIVFAPFNLLIYFTTLQCFKLFSFGTVASIFTPFVIVFVLVILISLKMSIFSCWMPLIAVKNEGIFKSLINNFKMMSRRFFKIFANGIGIVLTIIIINGFALLFTLGVGMLITIPLSMVLGTTFQMSSFYSSYGMRYYVDSSTIVEPKRMAATEKMRKTKFII